MVQRKPSVRLDAFAAGYAGRCRRRCKRYEKIGVLVYLNAVACLKSNTPSEGVRDACLELLKYAYTDEALANFTYTTGTTIGVEYLDKVDRAQLTPYEKTLIDYINKSDLVYQVSGTAQYAKSIKSFKPTNLYGSGTITGIVIGIVEIGVNAEDYFKGYQTWYSGLAW